MRCTNCFYKLARQQLFVHSNMINNQVIFFSFQKVSVITVVLMVSLFCKRCILTLGISRQDTIDMWASSLNWYPHVTNSTPTSHTRTLDSHSFDCRYYKAFYLPDIALLLDLIGSINKQCLYVLSKNYELIDAFCQKSRIFQPR